MKSVELKRFPKMPKDTRNANVFLVDTPYQLLNAIEAANSLELSNNYLIIVNEAGQASGEYKQLINKKDWDRVLYVSLAIDTGTCDYEIFGPRAAEIVRTWYGRYLHFRRMRRIAKITKSLSEVNNLFLGHYWAEYKYFMRHFANTLKYRTLYLLDDGTDTIDINDRRKLIDSIKCETSSIVVSDGNSLLKSIKSHLRRKYWNWNIEEAASVTFFTTYDLDIREGDYLVKNEYRYLRSLTASAMPNDRVYFLGQCLVEDGYIKEDVYIDYLRKAKAYLETEKLEYIPHPRESLRIINKIKQSLGFEIKQFGVPIEYEISVRGHIPKVLASFFCSALESCSNILGDKTKIIGFYLYPEHLMRMQDEVESIYKYFEKKLNPNFAIIKLGVKVNIFPNSSLH